MNRRSGGRLRSELDRRRDITERLVLSGLRGQDEMDVIVASGERAEYLARVSRELAMSLDEDQARETVRHLTLPRPGTWCIVDVIERDHAVRRLPVVHHDPASQLLVKALEGHWPLGTDEHATPSGPQMQSTTIGLDSGAALMRVAHSEENLRILSEIGFGAMLVVPLIVHARIQGAMTFISQEGDEPFTPIEIALAIDLAARCAMALDNARLHSEADVLRMAAQSANLAKSTFLGNMSHELRTPLNAIGGFADLMEMGIQGPVTDAQRLGLTRIIANQKHLLMLITEILNFVRVENGRTEYHASKVLLAEALSDVAGMLSGAIVEKGITLEGPTCAEPVVAWADASRVRQIIVNLVMNAVKYTQRKAGIITLSCSTTNEMAVVEVSDNGVGISAENLDTIFEPFVQLTAGLANREGGVGLGLAISRDLARAMGGDLTVTSEVGVGSQFRLMLPTKAK